MTLIALLGRRDSPTDALDDYCGFLAQGMENRGENLKLVRVPWSELGWTRALWRLWRQSRGWQRRWVLVQYTALSWSRRGLPLLFFSVLIALKIRGARIAIVFHDPHPYGGWRPVDRLRRVCQKFVMRSAYRFCDTTILTMPLDQVSWLPSDPSKANFIPVCATLPVIGSSRCALRNGNETKTITVLAVTDSGDIGKEVADITHAAMYAADRLPRVRLMTVGRGSAPSESRFREALKGSLVEFTALGVLPGEEVSRVIANSDVSLFVRGRISTQRSSAVASIANGVPLVAYADRHLPTPLAEAGILGVPYPDSDKLAEATMRVLTDPKLWLDLRERSRGAYEKYFSAEAVAGRFLEVLRDA